MDIEPFSLTPRSINYLSTAQKWAMFLAIMGFIFSAFLILIGIFIGTFMNFAALPNDMRMMISATSVIISIVYIIVAIIYCIPVWFLFQFSRKLKRALYLEDSEVLQESFRSLKNCFMIYSIFTIIAILLYCLFFVISFFTAVGTMGGLAV